LTTFHAVLLFGAIAFACDRRDMSAGSAELVTQGSVG
jgi:hypothetical protein